MTIENNYSLTIPEQLIDQIADRVAEKVLARVRPHLVKSVPEPALAMESDSDKPLPTFLRLRDLVDRLGVSRASIYKWMSEGRFPQSVSLGGRSVAWRREEVEAWESNPAAFRLSVMD